MQKCRTCRWWGLRETYGYIEAQADYGFFDVRYCKLASSDTGMPICSKSLAVAYDGYCDHADLQVSSEFGCVQWEAKDA